MRNNIFVLLIAILTTVICGCVSPPVSPIPRVPIPRTSAPISTTVRETQVPASAIDSSNRDLMVKMSDLKHESADAKNNYARAKSEIDKLEEAGTATKDQLVNVEGMYQLVEDKNLEMSVSMDSMAKTIDIQRTSIDTLNGKIGTLTVLGATKDNEILECHDAVETANDTVDAANISIDTANKQTLKARQEAEAEKVKSANEAVYKTWVLWGIAALASMWMLREVIPLVIGLTKKAAITAIIP